MNKKMKALAFLLVGIMSVGTMTACSSIEKAPVSEENQETTQKPQEEEKEKEKKQEPLPAQSADRFPYFLRRTAGREKSGKRNR